MHTHARTPSIFFLLHIIHPLPRLLQDAKDKYVKDQWSYDYFRDILGWGLVTSEGAKWRAHRKLLSPAFHFAALERLAAVFDAAAARMVASLSAGCAGAACAGGLAAALRAEATAGASRSDVTTVPLGGGAALMELSSHFRRVTLEVISQIALGFDPSQASVFPELFEAVLDELNQRPYKPWRSWLPHIELPHRARLRRINGIVDELVAARRAARGSSSGEAAAAAAPAQAASAQEDSAAAAAAAADDAVAAGDDSGLTAGGREIFAGGRGDMLDMILDSGANLSDAAIRDEVKTQLLAGHETSSMLLTWTCYLLAAHPDALARATAEADAAAAAVAAAAATGGAGATATAAGAAARGLVFLEWVMKEAMRLYPPVAAIMSRRTTQAITLGDWQIPRGAMLRITPWVLQRDPRWFAEPEAFQPERFLPDAEPPPRGAWMPFGAGPRVCIGQHFAMLEMTLVAAMLLQRYRLELPANAAPCEPELNVTLRPRGGVQLRLCRIGMPDRRLT